MTTPANKWAFALATEDGGATVTIDVLDLIGDWCGPNAVTARSVVAALDAAKDAKSIRCRINSAGGEVTEGLAIYNAMRAHPAKVEVLVMGVAASMASVVAMAGDTVTMAEGAFMMVHNPWTIAAGDGERMRAAADYLDKLRDSLVGIYQGRTKLPPEEIAAIMADETWLKADEAVAKGFADRVEKRAAAPQGLAYAALADFSKVPEELKDAVRAMSAARVDESQTPPPAPAGPAATEQQQPSNEEGTMPDDKKNEPSNVISIARALELPAGATEQDAVAAAVRLRQLEVQVQALTGAPTTAEAMGQLRAMKTNADKYTETAAKLAKVESERDLQNFDALILQGRNESKLSPADETFERERFDKAIKAGRGAEAVEELRGMLKVKAADARFTAQRSQPAPGAGAGSPLLHDGKAYKDLSFSARAKLAKENPELWKLMKADHEARTA